MAHWLVVVESHAIHGARVDRANLRWCPEVAHLSPCPPGERTKDIWATALAMFGRGFGPWGRGTGAVSPCTAPVQCLDGGPTPLTHGQWESFSQMRMQRLLGRQAQRFTQRIAPAEGRIRLCTAMPDGLLRAVEQWILPGLRRVELVPAVTLAASTASSGLSAIRCSGSTQLALITHAVSPSAGVQRQGTREITALGAPFPTSSMTESVSLRLEAQRLAGPSAVWADAATSGAIQVVDLCPPPALSSASRTTALIREHPLNGTPLPASSGVRT